ncbi:MAG: GNAT family N-acetyltransferase [Candidatus Latescibacteria bacterium]|nr:GNAT family N-acetyltransferase [Candidatus Latescibacterota bacterium]
MDAPRPARIDEYSQVCHFIDRVFRPGQQGRFILARQYPHLFQRSTTMARRLLLLRDEGELVGGLGIHPLTLRLQEARLKAGGIGQVAAHPQRRGQGIMSTLLNDAIQRMQRAGYALSVLGGDRQRYGWFGWENAGLRHELDLASRYLGAPSAADRKLKVQPLRPRGAVAGKIQRYSDGLPYGVVRPLGQMEPLFCRNGRQGWYCQEGGGFAYVVSTTRQGGIRLDEVGGDPELVVALLRRVLARLKVDRITLVVGPNHAELGLLRPYSGSWRSSTDCMVKIIDLERTVEGVTGLLRRRARQLGIKGTFNLQMGAQKACLQLGRGRTYRLVLDERAMVTLLFGSLPVHQALGGDGGLEILDRLLPLPLFIPPLNHI